MASGKVISRKNTFASLTKSAFNPSQNNDYESLALEHPATSRRDSSSISTPRNQSPNGQPPSPTNLPKLEPDYIYINKKKANDVIMTENLLQHSEYRKSFSLGRPNQLWTLDKLPTSQFSKSGATSPLHKPDNAFNEKDQIAAIARQNGSNLTIPGKKEIFDELVLAEKSVVQLAKFNPLSIKSPFEKTPKTSRDKSTQIIMTHSHRIYGSHHHNLKKINLMLGSPKTGGHHFTESKEKKSENQPLEADDNPTFKREDELGKTLAKGFNVYEYDPLTDEFQFTGPDMTEMEAMLQVLTDQHEELNLKHTHVRSKSKVNVLRKSQFQPLSQRDEKPRKEYTTMLPKIRAGSLRADIMATESNLSNRNAIEEPNMMDKKKFYKSGKDINDDINRKNKILKEIEKLCSQFTTQNQKMSNKFRIKKDCPTPRKLSSLNEKDTEDANCHNGQAIHTQTQKEEDN